MKRINHLLLIFIAIVTTLPAFSQEASQSTLDKRERKRNMTVKEWNTNVGKEVPFLDHVTTYNGYGQKIEEIEYATYGQKSRITFEYQDSTSKCIREVEYNDRDKVVRIRKIEYYEDGTKKKQYNYYPNGKLESVKDYEYIFK
ncbi:MAG: hypothetical protein PHU62_05180 [Bacteroidales bacterium]|jgi:hypothetical protein|nr:hypothetical protein [Bacteroidales bacterium]MDD2204626.1 hypothetical protein [Bacteroidales bacterium]MDD3152196.1 hypothetical protein [Bacteroidales bacterium]MDD3913699.1 hypothetical protein [Bacteroidales bacterium]MDD4633950.1 hypothetical protein [Bacteroidales bacterium]